MSRKPTKRRTKTIRTKVPLHRFAVYNIVARHFEISVEMLMQSELYNQTTALGDSTLHTLGILNGFESEANTELVSVTLTFTDETHHLLSAIATLVRRPLEELARGLLTLGADVMSSYFDEATRGEGLDNHEVTAGYLEDAIRFEIDAKRGLGPKGWGGMDCWNRFDLRRPSRFKSPPNIQKKGGGQG